MSIYQWIAVVMSGFFFFITAYDYLLTEIGDGNKSLDLIRPGILRALLKTIYCLGGIFTFCFVFIAIVMISEEMNPPRYEPVKEQLYQLKK